MTKQEWSVVKQSAIDKWEDAVKQTEDTYQEWWYEVGKRSCSFCKIFRCNVCPLSSSIDSSVWGIGPYLVFVSECAEWRNIRDNFTYKNFMLQSKLLLNKIKAIKYKNEWKELVCILEDL